MKLDKSQQKQIIDAIHILIKEKGYKIKANSIYTVLGNAFIHCDFLIVDSKKMVYRIYIKEYEYDNIFWNIMKLSDNAKKNDSLRACGAFKAPAILLKKGEIEFSEIFHEVPAYLVDLIDKCSYDFLSQYEIDDYIINKEKGVDKEILKCLAYLHIGEKTSAKMVAQDAITNGDKGNYENEGKTFFEWLLCLE